MSSSNAYEQQPQLVPEAREYLAVAINLLRAADGRLCDVYASEHGEDDRPHGRREPARSVTVWLGLAEDLARDDDPPFPPADAELGEALNVPGLVLPWRRTSVGEINDREGW